MLRPKFASTSLPHPPACCLTLALPLHAYSHIYGSLKITIDLPDEIFRQAKVLAAERQRTLESPLIQALQASNIEPMVPLTRDEIYAER